MAEPTRKRAILDYRVWIVSSLIIVGLAFGIFGTLGALGMALGIGFGMFSLWVIWLLILLLGREAPAVEKPQVGAVLSVLLFLIKLPLFFLMVFVTYSLGGVTPGCFAAGLILVYSLSIGWAVARH